MTRRKRKLRYGGAAVLRPDKQSRPVRPQREGVLVVIEHDGHVELYGRRDRLRVHVAHRLACPIESTEQRLLTEEILDLRLPAWARELYYPSNRLAVGDVRECLPPDEEVARLEALSWLKELEEWQAKWTAPPATT